MQKRGLLFGNSGQLALAQFLLTGEAPSEWYLRKHMARCVQTHEADQAQERPEKSQWGGWNCELKHSGIPIRFRLGVGQYSSPGNTLLTTHQLGSRSFWSDSEFFYFHLSRELLEPSNRPSLRQSCIWTCNSEIETSTLHHGHGLRIKNSQQINAVSHSLCTLGLGISWSGDKKIVDYGVPSTYTGDIVSQKQILCFMMR